MQETYEEFVELQAQAYIDEDGIQPELAYDMAQRDWEIIHEN